MIFERLRNSANLFAAWPLLVPGNNYDELAAQTRRALSPKQIVLRNWLIKYYSGHILSACAHLRAWRRIAGANPLAPVSDEVSRYMQQFDGRPFVTLFKLLEATHFRALPDNLFGERTLEIGVSDGVVSALHFAGRRIEFGSEYLSARLVSGWHLHDRLLAADLRHLPFADCSLRTVFLVHVIDDLPFSPELAFRELSRVICRGGFVVFSSVSDAYGQLDYSAVRRILPISRRAFARFKRIRFSGVHILSRRQLEESLGVAGFRMVSYQEFLSTKLSPAWDIGMCIEMSGSPTLTHLLRGNLFGMKKYWDRYLTFSLARVLEEEQKANGRGLNCFVVAQRQ